MSTTPQAPIFLSDEAFELLVRKVPAALFEEVPADRFDELIGVSRARFEEITAALGAGGRTQGLIGPEAATYLNRGLGLAILECSPAEFLTRMGVEREDAANMLEQLSFRLGLHTGDATRETR